VGASVTVYVTDICPYCTAAKQLLTSKGAEFSVISVETRADLREWLVKASGQRTVPQIFINGHSVGGFSDLAKLEEEGRLDRLLATEASVDNPPLRS